MSDVTLTEFELDVLENAAHHRLLSVQGAVESIVAARLAEAENARLRAALAGGDS